MNWIPKLFWILVIISFTYPLKTYAQFKIDILTNPIDWTKSIANGQLQIQPIRELSLLVGTSYSSEIVQLENFERRSNTITYTGEIRYFPFGAKDISFEDKPKGGYAIELAKNPCFQVDKKLASFLQGLYLAPGFKYTRTNALFIPNEALDVTIEEFPFTIKIPSLTLNIGYQIRIANLTLGASYGLTFSQPKWEGPIDMFGDTLYTHTYPFKFRQEHGLRVEAGVNF